jgi:hypothetical protein
MMEMTDFRDRVSEICHWSEAVCKICAKANLTIGYC